MSACGTAEDHKDQPKWPHESASSASISSLSCFVKGGSPLDLFPLSLIAEPLTFSFSMGVEVSAFSCTGDTYDFSVTAEGGLFDASSALSSCCELCSPDGRSFLPAEGTSPIGSGKRSSFSWWLILSYERPKEE
jgi:hypothetical protein